MLVLYCFCVATEFSVNKDLYIIPLLTLSAYNTKQGLCNGRASVCLYRFAAVGPAAMKCRSIAAAAGSATLWAYVVAEHRLVLGRLIAIRRHGSILFIDQSSSYITSCMNAIMHTSLFA